MARNAVSGVLGMVCLLGCGGAVEDDGEAIGGEGEAIVFPEAPQVQPRVYADLVFIGTIKLYDFSADETTALLDVKNVGNSPVRGGGGRVYTSNVVRSASLQNSKGGPVLEAGQTGFISVKIPNANAEQCRQHTAQLDLDHIWQYDSYSGTSVYDNDLAQLKAPCLSWLSPITTDTLGSTPDPLMQGKSLLNIVSSYDVGSSWGRCSHCHYEGTSEDTDYSPNVLQDKRAFIYPTQVIDYWRWAGSGGWAVRFDGLSRKPEAFKKVLKKWLANGAPLR